MTVVTKEDILKAKQILGLVKADGTEINKAEQMTIEKAEVLKAEYKENLKKAEEFMKKAEAIKVELEEAGHKMGETNGDDSEILSHKKAEDTDINKGGSSTTAAPAPTAAPVAVVDEKKDDVLMKAIDEKFTSLATLISAKDAENAELKKSLEDLAGKVDQIGKSSVGARSLTGATARERFPKTETGETILSLKNDRRTITAELVKAAKIGTADQDDIFAKAASTMEICGTIATTNEEANLIARKIYEKLKIKLTA